MTVHYVLRSIVALHSFRLKLCSVKYIVQCPGLPVLCCQESKERVYCDLQGSRVNGGTIPPNILLNSSKPDLVLVDRSTTPVRVDLVELTVPWDSGAEGAKLRKEVRYASLVQDIKEGGFQCFHTTLEVGVRGHITPRNKSTLTWLCSLAKEKKGSRFITTTSKLALLGSYSVWVARRSPDWTAGNLLKP